MTLCHFYRLHWGAVFEATHQFRSTRTKLWWRCTICPHYQKFIKTMAVATESVSILTLILSSAGVSALVNVAWNAFARYLDQRATAKKTNHVYLSLALQLEDFARRCNAQIYDINEASAQYNQDQGSSAFQHILRIELDLAPGLEWNLLPVAFVAEIKGLPTRFEQCNSWIHAQYDNWADLEEAYELEKERLAFYALKACAASTETRSRIGAGPGDLTHLISSFEHVIERSRAQYVKYQDGQPFIPELRAQFDDMASQNTHVYKNPALALILSCARAAKLRLFCR